MVRRCELCRIEVPNEHVLADHINGKRHQALLIARERFEASQNSSIYISRIKPEHDENILINYFSRFGSIKNCFIDKEKHVYAIIEYENIDSAYQCLKHVDEYKLDDGTRLKVKERNHGEFKSKRMLISEQEFLNISKEKEIEQHAIMIQTLNNKLTIEEQMETIAEQGKLINKLLKLREEFFQQLQTMFTKYFPEAKLCLIGSVANNLATSLSDMDLVLILNDAYIEPQCLSSISSDVEPMDIDRSNDQAVNQHECQQNTGHESSSTHALSPPSKPLSCTADELLQMSISDRLDYIRRLLRSYAPYVCHVQRIAQARCPVIRFCHKEQRIFCELSINNHLAVANTELIRFYLIFEPKLRSLLYAIRLWIKQKDLLGKGHRFNTYTLFWMIVCTLQLNNKLLPSVQELVERAKQMLHNFFVFYSTLNATEYELSPWTGNLKSKTSNAIPFSIFDPFEHDHNLTSNISQTHWLKFQEECSLANRILNECSKKRHHKSWGLSLLITRKSLPQQNFTHEPQQSYPNSKSIHTIELVSKHVNEEQFQNHVKFILKEILLFEQVDYELTRKKRPASPSMMITSEETPATLAERLDETLSTKRRRTDDDEYILTPINDASHAKEKTYFRVMYRTWQDRRKFRRCVDNENKNTSMLDYEKLISNKLKEENDHCLEAPIYLSMEINLLSTAVNKNNTNKAQIHFELQTTGQHQLFVDLTHFLTFYLAKMLGNSSAN